MITQMLEFEMTFEPEKKKLTLIDYNSPKGDDKPLTLTFTNVGDTDGIKTVIGAWIELKENVAKNDCNS